MRAFTLTAQHHHHYPSLYLPFTTKTNIFKSLNFTSLPSKHSLSIHCTLHSDASGYDDNDDDYCDDGLVSGDESSDFLEEDGVFIEVEKLGRNSRRIKTKIGVEASLDDVWRVLTDYERLSEFIPGLVASKLVEKQDNFARILQIGQHDLPLGVKVSAKAVLDCYERELQLLNSGKRRDIEFKMTEGDFQVFEGKWSIEQVDDWVFLKLQPYRQITAAKRQSQKLSKRFYGPFRITAKIGSVAYKLALPEEAKIHNVFHVSKLKKCKGDPIEQQFPLPMQFLDSHPILKPTKILGFRKIWQLGKFCPQVLVQWESQQPSDATWESAQEFQQDFPDFNLEDKIFFEDEGNVTSPLNSPARKPEETQQHTTDNHNHRVTRSRKIPKQLNDYVLTIKK